MAKPVDVVIMWVDDQWPGYRETLAARSGDPRDLNPNRTRDNLGLLRYGLRSIEAYVPELRHVYLFTMRPQVPAWLNPDHPDLRIVHHDEVIAPQHLPTFNSFGIMSHLHLLPGLGEDVIFLEDDMMLNAPGALAAFHAPQGQPHVFLKDDPLPRRADLDAKKASPWNLALAHTATTLSTVHGARRWPRVIHGPLWIDRDAFAKTMERYADEIEATRAAPFRSDACIAPEMLYPLDQWARGAMVEAPPLTSPMEGYASLENLWLWTWMQLWWLKRRAPRTLCLNDSFGARPNPRVEALVGQWLERRFPVPSRFEAKASR